MNTRPQFLADPTRHLFFTGKGGVGKTSIACAAAIALADAGRRVLLVSTDPASNLTDVLGTMMLREPTPVEGVSGLTAYDLDPVAAAAAYRERVVAPYRGVLPDASVASIEEQLSGACTVEIAAFDEFSSLLGDPRATIDVDHVVFDTAPTGHTLRLLTLPAAWTEFLDSSSLGTSCLGPLAGLQNQQALYAATLAALADPERSAVLLVTRPESSALAEAARTSRELRGLGVANQGLIVNAVFRATAREDPLALALEERGRSALVSLPPELGDLERTDFALVPYAPMGVQALRAFWQGVGSPTPATRTRRGPVTPSPIGTAVDLGGLVDRIAAAGNGVAMTMGKGGVGKTTIAAAVALGLAERGHPVCLSTTDPAAGVERALDGGAPEFTVTRIDPAAEVARYRAEVMERAGADMSPEALGLLEEDLRSPCTEEIAVFQAFARTIAQGTDGFVVLDTAPTGHTILLLDAALAYHRELGRQSGRVTPEVQEMLPRLRDPDFTRVLLVTLAEATPVNEAAQLADDLARADIVPCAWVINQSLTPTMVTDPVLLARRALEVDHIDRVAELADLYVVVPWQVEPPAGRRALLGLVSASESVVHAVKEV